MRILIFILILSTLVLVSCSSGQANVSGEYTLVSIDSNPIPYAPTHEGQQGPQVLGGSMVLNEDGTFSMTMDYAGAPGNTISRDFSGTYEQSRDAFVFTWEGAGKTPVTIEAETLTLDNEGILFVFEK